MNGIVLTFAICYNSLNETVCLLCWIGYATSTTRSRVQLECDWFTIKCFFNKYILYIVFFLKPWVLNQFQRNRHLHHCFLCAFLWWVTSEREFSGENSRASKGVKRAKGNRFCVNTVRDFFGVVYWFMIFNVLWNSNIVKWLSKTGARGHRSSIGPNHDISVCSIYYLQFVCVGNSTLWLILQLGISFLSTISYYYFHRIKDNESTWNAC